MHWREEAKKRAALKAVKLIEDGQIVGLGTGSTVYYAIEELGLKNDKNYTTYIQLDKDYIADVVSACNKEAFEPYTWWFPFFGSFPYKGFFKREDALKLAKKLRKKLDFKIADFLDADIAASGRKTLIDYYHKKGFAFVEVTLDTEELLYGKVNYTINEGPRVKIKSVTFSGNDALKTKALHAAGDKSHILGNLRLNQDYR